MGTIYVYMNFPTAAGTSPAYPLGDKNAFAEGMTDPDSYDPIPNAIFFNWVTIIVLALGNIAAIDFQARPPRPLPDATPLLRPAPYRACAAPHSPRQVLRR